MDLGAFCQFPICHGVSLFANGTVCSGHGVCVRFNSCNCSVEWGGEQCAIPRCDGFLKTDKDRVCFGHGTCKKDHKCYCAPAFLPPSCRDFNIVLLSLKYLLANWYFSFIGIALCCLCVFVFSNVFICLRAFRQKQILQRYRSVEDIDLLVSEQKASQKGKINIGALLKFDKKLFQVKASELKLKKTLGRGGSSAIVFECKLPTIPFY